MESSLKEMKWRDHHKLVKLNENAEIPAEVEGNPIISEGYNEGLK